MTERAITSNSTVARALQSAVRSRTPKKRSEGIEIFESKVVMILREMFAVKAHVDTYGSMGGG